jgi:hypothetical protein
MVHIKEYVSEADSKVEGLQLGLSKLDLSTSDAVHSDDGTQPSVYKITGRSRFKIVDRNEEEGSGSKRSSPPGFSDIGGLEKQIHLLKDLVLYPLKAGSNGGSLIR